MKKLYSFSEYIKMNESVRRINEEEENDDISIERVIKKKTGELEKIIISLKKSESGKMTKIVKRYVEVYDQLKELEEIQSKLSGNIIDFVHGSIKEEEKFYTKIVQTAKVALTVSKETEPKVTKQEKIDYDAVLSKISEVFPEIKKQLNELINEHTKIVESVSGGRKASISISNIKIEEGVKDSLLGIFDYCKKIFEKLKESLKRTNESIDSTLSEVQRLMKA